MSSTSSRQERIDAEAADWLAAIECSTADARAFQTWRAADPAHALAYIRVSQIARDLDALRETGLSENAAGEQAMGDRAPAEPSRRKLLKFGLAGIFAAGAIAAGVGGLGLPFAAAAQDAETAVGERRRIVVAEGIALELNTNSHVRWRRIDGGYDVELLRGEVMLDRDSGSAPCRLHCRQSQVDLAPGAQMVARADARDVNVAVLKGEASLKTSASAAAVRVPTLRKAKIVTGQAPALSALSELEAGSVSAWQQGQLQFNGESLEAAVAEYNRYLSRPIEIDDPSIRSIRLGGRFPANDPSDFCRALREIYGVSAHIEPKRIRLGRG